TALARGDQDAVEALGKDLPSLRVASVNPNTKTVTFLPAKLQVLGAPGKAPAGLPRVDLPDGKVLVQGRLALAPDAKELEEFRQPVRAAFPGYRPEPARLESFEVILRSGNEVVFERPLAGGDPSNITVQATIKGKGDLKADGVLIWVEKMPPLQATVRFDLVKI